jgi:hypothetical protein
MGIGVADALIYKVQTLVDGGLRVTLDLSANDIEIVQKLLLLYSQGDSLIKVGFAHGE